MQNETSLQATYHRIAIAVEANLKQHVLNTWFPRSVDEDYGGFNQFFREDWSQEEIATRSLVYQSRLTWVAAKAAKRCADKDSYFPAIAMHGMRFLRETFWDEANGGLHWALNANGCPMPFKHTYGIAFAIYASAATFDLTLNDSSLGLARNAFAWLDKHAFDFENGGYFEALDVTGKPIRGPEDAPDSLVYGLRPGKDAIGTVYGLKSMNTHIHLLEAFSALYEVWPLPKLGSRLHHLYDTLMEKVIHPDGYLHLYFQPDWTVIPSEDSYGHDIETAFLLVEAAQALDIPDDSRTWKIARQIVDHTLSVGWDETYSGLYGDGDPVTGPTRPDQKRKGWWEQAESLNALLLMHERFGSETDRYWNAFLKQWAFIEAHQVDPKYGGWYHTLSREGIPPPGARKSDAWTDPYHQGRALMNVADRLLRLAR